MAMTEITYAVAFTGGILSFFSPCILPLVPAYIASLAGITSIEPNVRRNYLPIIFHSLSFVLGFSLVFTCFGASVGLIGTALIAHSLLLRQIAGALIIVFGALIIAAYKLSWLNYEKNFISSLRGNPGYLRSVVLGAAFALGWTPCVGPVLGAILTLAWSSHTAVQGVYLLATYSLGLGIPFILLGVAWGVLTPLWRGINRYLGAISIASGILLIIVGILILTGSLEWLSSFVNW